MKIFAVALVISASNVAISAPVTVLGLPLGGKLPYALSVCSINTDGIKKVCWVGQPFTHKDGSKSGHAALPNPEGRPYWAAYSSFEFSVTKDWTLRQIKVRSDGADRAEIYQSLATRFGPPWNQSKAAYIVNWDKEDVVTELMCFSQTKCITTFSRTPSDEDLARTAAAKKTEKARPIAP